MKHGYSKILAASALLCAAFTAQSQEYPATITASECDVVSVQSNAAGTIVGESVGRAAGNIAAEAIFGRGASGLGGFLGGIGGALAGDAVTKTRTHHCVITADVSGVGKVFLETTGAPRNAGQKVIVVRKPSGDYMVKPMNGYSP